MIRYVTGDATNPPLRPAAIVHVVNDRGAWGAGFSGALSARWPRSLEAYLAAKHSGDLVLGRVLVSHVADGLVVLHLVAQRGLPSRVNRHPLDLDALRRALGNADALFRGVPWHMPRIGTGYGGGTWDEVEPLLAALDRDITVYDLEKR